MKYYWDWCDILFDFLHERVAFFLFVNTVIFGCLGFFVWYILHFFCLDSLIGMICFIGYSAVISGYLGGLFYFMRKD